MGHRVFGLDLMRAVAIWLVLLNHAIPLSFLGLPPESPPWRLAGALGTLGVELFFVLSGYLVGGIALRDVRSRSDLRRFWSRRWLRTLPAYYIVLACYVVSSSDPAAYLPHVVFVQNVAGLADFGVSWSLAVEEWFYLSLPLLVLLSGKRVPLALSVVLVCSLIVRSAIAMTTDVHYLTLHYAIPLRFEPLCAGALLAWTASRRVAWFRLLTRRPVFLLGVLVALLAVELIVSVGFQTARAAYLPMFGLGAALMLPRLTVIPWRWVPAAATSRLAYSLYLVHGPAMLAAAAIVSSAFVIPLGIAVSYLAATPLYFFVERPFMRLRDRRATA